MECAKEGKNVGTFFSFHSCSVYVEGHIVAPCANWGTARHSRGLRPPLSYGRLLTEGPAHQTQASGSCHAPTNSFFNDIHRAAPQQNTQT